MVGISPEPACSERMLGGLLVGETTGVTGLAAGLSRALERLRLSGALK